MPPSPVDNIIEESLLPSRSCVSTIRSIPQCPFSIEYEPALLGEIRSEVERARNSPHGGHEVGGVLFGIQEPDCVRILAHRPLHCEHAMGFGFVLGERDEQRLAQLILTPATDPKMSGLQAIGWYHSHLRSRIFLSELDRQIHTRHFDGSFNLALVIRPSSDGSVRAAFFFRESSGEMRTDSCYEEFTMEAPGAEGEIQQAPSREERGPLPSASTASKVKTHHPIVCPRCGSKHIRRSRRTGLIERFRGLLGFFPYRCHECLSRSLLKTADLLEHPRTRSRKRPEERRRSRVRTRRELLLWGGGILGFLAILRYLIRDSGSGPDQP
jgi:proteasome lid subunit RPN8/RPN11/DNA-directed RNA polymerase subunit RPC12/RpoP